MPLGRDRVQEMKEKEDFRKEDWRKDKKNGVQ